MWAEIPTYNDLSGLTVSFFLLDFHFGEHQLTKQQCLQNLTRAEEIYSSILSPGAFHLSPGEILRWSQSRILDCNIQALLAHLYHCFEVRANRQSHIKPLKSSSDSQLTTNRSHEDTGSLSRRQNLLRRSKLLSKGTNNTQKVGSLPQPQLHSFSTSDLNPSRILTSQRKVRPLVVDTQAVLLNVASNQSLSSFSASALVPDTKEIHKSHSSVQPSTTVFKAPIRSSLSVSQAAALSHFDRLSMKLGKGPHTQSSPALHVSTTLPNLPQPSKQDIITASTDNLMIREQMLASKPKRTTSNTANASLKPKSLTVPTQPLSSRSASDISGGSDDEFIVSSPGADVSGNCTTSWNAATTEKTLPYGEIQEQDPPYQPPDVETVDFNARAMPPPHLLQLESEPQEIARRSFTLDKQHTIATASAAGLPIIGSGKDFDHQQVESLSVNHVDTDIKETPSQLREEEPLVDYSTPSRHHPHIQDKTRSTSSSSSSPTVMCLVVYSDPQDDHAGAEARGELVPSVPASVVEQLRLVLSACKNTNTMQERNVLTKQQQLRQKVHLSYVHKVKERKSPNSTHTGATGRSHHKQAATRENQHDSHKTMTPTNTTHVIVPRDPPAHSMTRIISQPASSGSVGSTRPRDTGILLPQSSTAKKLPQPLRELHLSPIGQSRVLRAEDESKPSNLVPERSQPNPWIEVTAAGKGQEPDTVRCEIHYYNYYVFCDEPINFGLKVSLICLKFQITQEEVRHRKELQMRTRLEERERNRRKDMEKRRKEQAKRRYGLSVFCGLRISVFKWCFSSWFKFGIGHRRYTYTRKVSILNFTVLCGQCSDM